MSVILLAILRAYRLILSPLLPPSCRFQPTCSAYAIQAIRLHGAWMGSKLALCRIARCHPFSLGGHDPVPGAVEKQTPPRYMSVRPHDGAA